MPIQHIVLFEPKDGASDADIKAAMDAVAAVKENVPGVLDCKTGENITDRAPGVKYAAVVTLEDRDALAAYGPHPEHQKVVELLKVAMESWTVVDFEE